jgi:hypothetical protein
LFIFFSALFILPEIVPGGPVFAQEHSPTPTPESQPKYFYENSVRLNNGLSLDQVIINGPPKPPPGLSVKSLSVSLPEPNQESGTNSLNVPAYDWSFGCSATSAAMIAAYFDINGFPDIYTGPTNGGVMPMDNSVWPDWISGCGNTRNQNPLSATHSGLDGRSSRGHVDDYWTCVESTADDPFIVGGWTEHSYGDATGDYMYTNQSTYGNIDGATQFWGYSSGDKLYCSDLEAQGGSLLIDGTLGFKNFYESRGYTVTDCYAQKTDNKYAGGFSFEDYKAEIDAGQPVMIHVTGHTMVGVGYADPSTVYLHDTWDYNTHSMTWGGSYYGMDLYSVSIVHLGTSEMDVQGSGQSIPDGAASPSPSNGTDFGEAGVGLDAITHSFTIENTGTGVLSLDGTPLVSISGTHAADFTVTAVPVSPVASGGGTTTFEITFDPAAGGLREAVVSIANNDTDENPYDFAVQGTGKAPEIDLQGNGESIPDGDAEPGLSNGTDFGEAVVGLETVSRTFTVANSGDADLNLTGDPKVEITGAHAADFTVTAVPASPVASGGGTTTFEITFAPAAGGLRQAQINIANNDTDENPYDFAVQGTGQAPEIDLQGNGESIPDGDVEPGLSDGTDFGEAVVGLETVSRTFTIANSGDADLNLTGDPKVEITGTHAADFTVTAVPDSPVASGGGTTTFEITFDPGDSGLRQAQISIANNDTDESPYSVSIQGTGTIAFGDVPTSHWAYDDILALWDAGYTAGCSTDPLLYCPDTVMDRAQSAVFMLRGQLGTGYSPPPEPWDTFADDWSLSDISWAEKWAEGMWDEGLTAGCQADPLMYCPRRELPRVEASVFGLRMKHGINYTPPAATGTLFADMTDPDYWGTKWAEQAYLDGLLPECGTQDGKPLFCPDDLLDRAWGAYLIVNAKDLSLP